MLENGNHGISHFSLYRSIEIPVGSVQVPSFLLLFWVWLLPSLKFSLKSYYY